MCGDSYTETVKAVALLAEGVDRNVWSKPLWYVLGVSPSSRRAWIEIDNPAHVVVDNTSPSSRRAWIEINNRRYKALPDEVALLAEGVDRNYPGSNR